jgi:hypothetical protein
MIKYRTHKSNADLIQILELQRLNLKIKLSEKVKNIEGFVTIEHNLTLLQTMCGQHRHIVAEVDERICGYALVMIPNRVAHLPDLQPLVYNSCRRRNGTIDIDKCDFLVMGQVCVDKNFRGQGLFRGLYNCFKKNYCRYFNAVVTEISVLNTRSLRAHAGIGFREIERHTDAEDEWVVVEWVWRL